MKLILASASPRRRQLLEQVGVAFAVRPANVPEQPGVGEEAVAYALRLAHDKAFAVESGVEEWVLGADTVVVAPDGSILGKPADDEDARRMLRLLSGATHQVVTGVCLRSPLGEEEVAAELTYVSFLSIGEDEITRYIQRGESSDKAGAYAIQGYAARWIPRVQGCPFNVVGLPLSLVCSMLGARGLLAECSTWNTAE